MRGNDSSCVLSKILCLEDYAEYKDKEMNFWDTENRYKGEQQINAGLATEMVRERS